MQRRKLKKQILKNDQERGFKEMQGAMRSGKWAWKHINREVGKEETTEIKKKDKSLAEW